MRPILIAALAAPLLTAPALLAPARAQGIDMTKGGPVEVTSDDGMEWHQDQQVIIAKGNAKAVRGNVTVTADELIARYRKKTPTAGDKAAAPAAASLPGTAGSADDTGNNEVYRLEAVGHVHIFTPTDQAFGDHAVYDIDQAVLVLTGAGLKIITPQQVMTARDSMEYWSQKHMAVGRGDATVTTSDGRRVSADILVGYTEEQSQPGTPPVQKVSAQPAPGKPSDPATGAGGKLKRVDAFGHVVVQTATEVVHGDQGVYVPDTGIARLVGHVHITRGQNELNGDEAIVNMKTGISTLTRRPGSRVEGLVVPNEASTDKTGAKADKPAGGAK